MSFAAATSLFSCDRMSRPVLERAVSLRPVSIQLVAFLGLLITALLLLPTPLLAGGQTLDAVRDKWVGKPLSALIEAHGYPDENFRAPNGHMVQVYSKRGEKLVAVPVIRQPQLTEIELYETKSGAYSYGTSRQPGGIILEQRVAPKHCTGYFEINDQDTIINVRFKGKDCPR